MTPRDQEKIREIPISLRGIESILRVLNNELKEPSSIRQISEITGLSMRVAKNILMQLENLKQVERVVDRGQILPKWGLTRLGKENAKAIEKSSNGLNKNPSNRLSDLLLNNIQIPKNVEEQNIKIGAIHRNFLKILDKLKLNLSKSMGICYNLEQPIFAERMGNLINKLKSIKTNFSSFRVNPLSFYDLHKKGTKKKSSARKKKDFISEILFINQILLNQLNNISELELELSNVLEQENYRLFNEIYRQITDQIRILNYSLQKRTNVDDGIHILTEDELMLLQKNEIRLSFLKNFIPPILQDNRKEELLKECLLSLISDLLAENSKNYNKPYNIPLVSFYELAKDQCKFTGFSVENLEETLIQIAENGLISGIIEIQDDENHIFKIVQLKPYDVSVDEIKLLRLAIHLKSFSMADVMEKLDWNQSKVEKILQTMTNNGLLRHSKSYLQGDKWYILM
ncbi:hypothetical protein DSAG12_01531 [Promethearchaeum syntrophicum]|uniref:Uncharacterized protein n=1 Tax=Promethearchaeum syntrophicum TaxID=2594042 RepID=A0A5B9D993_9ARCH|nr:hypothetical protein [Candidatus Prometheoarchaeum syntrophicum]QEE15704.1 Sugar-specific transcriptional regulator TrmB [Candidatus Prometheoarchaeum syntrophicum]